MFTGNYVTFAGPLFLSLAIIRHVSHCYRQLSALDIRHLLSLSLLNYFITHCRHLLQRWQACIHPYFDVTVNPIPSHMDS